MNMADVVDCKDIFGTPVDEVMDLDWVEVLVSGKPAGIVQLFGLRFDVHAVQ